MGNHVQLIGWQEKDSVSQQMTLPEGTGHEGVKFVEQFYGDQKTVFDFLDSVSSFYADDGREDISLEGHVEVRDGTPDMQALVYFSNRDQAAAVRVFVDDKQIGLERDVWPELSSLLSSTTSLTDIKNLLVMIGKVDPESFDVSVPRMNGDGRKHCYLQASGLSQDMIKIFDLMARDLSVLAPAIPVLRELNHFPQSLDGFKSAANALCDAVTKMNVVDDYNAETITSLKNKFRAQETGVAKAQSRKEALTAQLATIADQFFGRVAVRS